MSFKHKRHLFGISVQQSKVWRGIHEPLKSICICAHYYCYKPESQNLWYKKKFPRPLVATNINSAEYMPKLDPLGSTVRYQVMKLCSGSVWGTNDGGIKIESAAGRRIFLPKRHANSWKTEFLYSLASSSKTKRDIGMGPTGGMMLTYWATNALLTNSGCGAVLTVFCLPEVGRCR